MSRIVLTLNFMLLSIYMIYSRPVCIAKMLLRASTDLVTHKDVLFHLSHTHCTHFSNTDAMFSRLKHQCRRVRWNRQSSGWCSSPEIWTRGFLELGCEKGPERKAEAVPTHPLFVPNRKPCAEQTRPLL